MRLALFVTGVAATIWLLWWLHAQQSDVSAAMKRRALERWENEGGAWPER